jgi:hypothetical protein
MRDIKFKNMLSIFKKKEKEENKENSELENVKIIAVPDIRNYMIKGYEEIREVKQQKENLEEKVRKLKEEANKNEQLYNAQLIVSQELTTRNKELENQLSWAKDKEDTQTRLRELDNKENRKIIDELKEEKYILEEKLKNKENITRKQIKEELIKKIEDTKGRLSKEIVIDKIKEM